MNELVERGRHALVVAIGGGGDIASAAVIAKSLARFNLRYTLSSIAWERYINDPVPGPIKLSEIMGYLRAGDGYVLINENSYAVRNGRKVVFQAVNASKATGEPVYIVDMYGGVKGYVKALSEVMSEVGADFVIGVDVGGDSLAKGCEESLWSPLADWIGVSVLGVLRGILAVHSPGSDGELEQSYVLARIDEVAQNKGLIAVSSLTQRDIELLEKILQYVRSEASLIPLLAFKGYRGSYRLRMGSRSVNVNFINTLTFYLSAKVVNENVRVLRELASTSSLEEAKTLLNKHGIYTELDLEEDLAKLGVDPEKLTAELFIAVRQRGLRKLEEARLHYCSATGSLDKIYTSLNSSSTI